MKKLLIFILVFGMASLANAELLISVDGVVNPPETSITLTPSQNVVIDIMGDGRPPPKAAFLVIQGPGAIAGYSLLYPGAGADYMEIEEFATGASMTVQEVLDYLNTTAGFTGATDMSFMNFLDTTPVGGPYDDLDGKLVDEIIFTCTGLGDVTLTLTDNAFSEVFDTQIIHQVPEPMTVLLLGLGGLFLRRSKKGRS